MTITYILLGRQQPVFSFLKVYILLYSHSLNLPATGCVVSLESCNMSIIVIFVV